MASLGEAVYRAARGGGRTDNDGAVGNAATRPFILDVRQRQTPNGQGALVIVGTQRPRGFPQSFSRLATGVLRNKQHCHRNDIVPLNAHFRPTFEVGMSMMTY